MNRPADSYWFHLADEARRRGCGRCEFCELRPIADLHHRTYAREGQERIEDVMAVCRPCHRVIHGRSSEVTVAVKSLAALGDRGKGIFGVEWNKYLQRRKHWESFNE